MIKNKIRVLISFLLILFSCVLTVLFLFVEKGNNIGKDIVVEVSDKVYEKADDEVLVDTVSYEENINDNKEKEDINIDNTSELEQVDVEEVVEKDIVYDGMTMDELASKLDRSLKNELNGKGYLYASYSLEKGVDPYLAAAISLEETGCNWNCSNLVKSCNNVGGMKGSGCGSYGYFDTLDNGIRAFIDNIARNYVAYGLTTAELMNPKYAENPLWSNNVNNYITRIKNN